MNYLSKLSATGTFLRTLRIVSGLYLLGFVASHMSNLSLGLHSIEAMDLWRPYLTAVWTTGIMQEVLLFMLLTHYLIGLHTIYVRPSLGSSMQDVVQVISGLLVLPLMAVHVVGVSFLHRANVEFSYEFANVMFWVTNPAYGLIQILLLSVVWIHGCAGLFTWLRSKPGALGWLPWLYPLAVAMPVVALLGYVQAGQTVIMASKEGHDFYAELFATQPQVRDVQLDMVKTATNWTIWISSALGIAVLAARWLRRSLSRPSQVSLRRNLGAELQGETGQTLLGAFVKNHQPHAQLCAGRGRCGTCVVRILSSSMPLPDPSELELETLRRTDAPEGARLACQLMLTQGGHVEVEALYPADYSFEDGRPAILDLHREAPA